MCAAWKKKNERNEIVCFYCTQYGILCGIAKFSRGNKNKLRTFQPQKWKKLRTASLKQNVLVLIKKKSVMKTSSWLLNRFNRTFFMWFVRPLILWLLIFFIFYFLKKLGRWFAYSEDFRRHCWVKYLMRNIAWFIWDGNYI